MPKKLSTKEIRKKDRAHPKSRKSQQIQRSLLRKDRLDRIKQERTKSRFHPLVDRLTWFQLAIDPEEEGANPSAATGLDSTRIEELVCDYLGRFDQEYDTLLSAVRPGRPRPKRLDELEMVRNLEADQYSKGSFEIPSLDTAAGVEALMRWDGSYHSIGLVPMTKAKVPLNK